MSDASPAGTPADLRARLTLAQKAGLLSGRDFWSTKAVEEVGIRSLLLTDGPHGVRKQRDRVDHLGLEDSVPATCFPPAVALGASWDPDLAVRVAQAIADEATAEGVDVVLGPGINIKRSPLCGRNFEYFSEDPLVAAVMGGAIVRGLQSRGVGSSLKHFAANNQETDRMRVSAEIDSRPLHEIYLRAFERVVERERPWTVMCSYNRINGVYTSQDRWLLTEMLRHRWGFDGVVVSDWGAVDDRVAALAAGLDLEMPSSRGRTDAEVVEAVRDGSLAEAVVDQAVDRMLALRDRVDTRAVGGGGFDVAAHHALAREAAARSIVLLKNDGVLPLRRDESLAVIGAFAAEPRMQGAGSSRVNPTRVDAALPAVREASSAEVRFAEGFDLSDADPREEVVAARHAAAVEAAVAAETVLMFLGLPEYAESEGFDREHLRLPADQLDLLDAVLAANPRVIVVLSAGSAVELPFADEVPAIVGASMLGQGAGSGTADVLFGVVEPSGRLTETFPVRLEDTPAFGNFPGEFGHVRYGEGILVGYRGYDARRLPVRFPFGHGLSYTSFAYGDVAVKGEPDGDLRVVVPVTNSGPRRGREVVQVYASLADSVVLRPPRALVGFAAAELDPGETCDVEVVVDRRDLAYWDIRLDDWRVEAGSYTFEVGASSRDLRAATVVPIDGDSTAVPLSMSSAIGELLAHPVTAPLMREAAAALGLAIEEGGSGSMFSDEAMRKMMANHPADRVFGFPEITFTRADLAARIDEANAASSD